MDIKSKELRSQNMAAIKNKDTKPEVFLRKCLFSHGYRYRLHSNKLPGHPDLWLSKYNTAIFVNGCFWHRHANCKYAYVPKSRVEFWNKKFEANIARDNIVREELNRCNVRVLVVWECSLKKCINSAEKKENFIKIIESFLSSDANYFEV